MTAADACQGSGQYYLITGRTDRCEANAISALEQSATSGKWVTVPNDSGDEKWCADLTLSVKRHFTQWLDTLGQESAAAQNLKQPITCWEKLRPDGVKAYSPVKIADCILLVVEQKLEDFEPHAFLRVGSRSLFLEKEGQLVKREATFCALDFYCRVQRQGFGLLLLSHALRLHDVEARHMAFDRPTEAMVSFLQKHFAVGQPLVQHNRFVIFPGFFSDRTPC